MKDYSLWLLNPTETEIEVKAAELCGFGTGAYEESVVGTLAFIAYFILRKLAMNYLAMMLNCLAIDVCHPVQSLQCETCIFLIDQAKIGTFLKRLVWCSASRVTLTWWRTRGRSTLCAPSWGCLLLSTDLLNAMLNPICLQWSGKQQQNLGYCTGLIHYLTCNRVSQLLQCWMLQCLKPCAFSFLGSAIFGFDSCFQSMSLRTGNPRWRWAFAGQFLRLLPWSRTCSNPMHQTQKPQRRMAWKLLRWRAITKGTIRKFRETQRHHWFGRLGVGSWPFSFIQS